MEIRAESTVNYSVNFSTLDFVPMFRWSARLNQVPSFFSVEDMDRLKWRGSEVTI